MQRRVNVLVGLVALVSAACGGGATGQRAVDSLPDGHRVVVHDLRVVGPLAGVVEVQVVTDQAVIFPLGEPAALVFQIRAAESSSIGRLPFHSAVAGSVAGGGVLGYRGVCGPGWDEDGRAETADPCPAADPATEVPAGTAIEVPLMLHHRAGTGTVTPGEYHLAVPLDETSTLEIDLELRAVRCQQGPATTAAGMEGGGEYTCALE